MGIIWEHKENKKGARGEFGGGLTIFLNVKI
jgi:hypothetical protein